MHYRTTFFQSEESASACPYCNGKIRHRYDHIFLLPSFYPGIIKQFLKTIRCVIEMNPEINKEWKKFGETLEPGQNHPIHDPLYALNYLQWFLLLLVR